MGINGKTFSYLLSLIFLGKAKTMDQCFYAPEGPSGGILKLHHLFIHLYVCALQVMGIFYISAN